MNNERDTHFQGFAKLFADELDQIDLVIMKRRDWQQQARQLITQRAYDLIRHTIEYVKTEVYYGNFVTWADASDIPDLTQRPEERERE